MAIGVNPVQRQHTQQVKRSGGKTGQALQGLGALAGGVIGGMAGPGGAAMGALSGASAGAGLGSFIGGQVDPVRQQVTQGPTQTASAPLQTSQIAQKYKLTDAGRAALQGLEVAKANPQFAEYQEPLALAIMTDIAQNNQAGRA